MDTTAGFAPIAIGKRCACRFVPTNTCYPYILYCPPIASSILTIISCCSSDNNLPRSTYRYAPKQSTDRQEQLYQRVIALSWHHPRYGYRRIRALLAREGWQVSRKQVQRIRRREGLKVREKPKKIPRRGNLHRSAHSGDASPPRVDLGFHL